MGDFTYIRGEFEMVMAKELKASKNRYHQQLLVARTKQKVATMKEKINQFKVLQ
jgi:hypothetical protein